ncbi:uncharacterized protein ColSpa_07972 [Colletotrichum spaethianum]|uniref:Uncharacterized protein n=1 Tax=Colletotrichum spaethianum TaxID=700344 RepID=A0AA37UJD3_9PEZI|nr:uncharacterized protein ColSpa_07972 [Colletotrichum spaethianum]GKT47791.1 hypothetical protein ColSpa_07972 [Colletotrichum spaethianum]
MAHENPFAPRSIPWNGYQAGPYHDDIPPLRQEPQPMWNPAVDYFTTKPGPSPAVPQHPYPYPDPRTQYHGDYMPAQHPPDPYPVSEPVLPSRTRRRPPPPTTEVPSQDQNFEHLQRRLKAMEIDNRHEKSLRQARKEQERADRQKMDMETKFDQLRMGIERSFKADIRDAVHDIRREIQLSQSESQSEPGRMPPGTDRGRRGYTAPARSIHGNRGVWEGRQEREQDLLSQEFAQFMEGKRRLHPQVSTPGVVFGNGAQAGPGSARGSRMDPEVRSEIETIIYDMFGGPDMVEQFQRRAPSRSVNRRAASDVYNPRTASQADPWDWHHGAYNRVNPALTDPNVPRRSPVRVTFEQDAYARPIAATNRPTDERDWLGVPPKSRKLRRRREDAGGGPTASQLQNAGRQQPPPPLETSGARHHAGMSAQDARFWGEVVNGEVSASANAMAYQENINNNGVQQGWSGNPARPLTQRDRYRSAATYEDEYAGESFTDDESDTSDMFPKRDASYPEFPAGHPDLRHHVQLPRAPDPAPFLRQHGI